MCQQCQDLAVKYLDRWISRDKMYGFLYANTCFPHGGPEYLEPQLHILNCIADQCGDIHLAAAILHGMWDLDLELTNDTHKGATGAWWDAFPLTWCEGLEQPGWES